MAADVTYSLVLTIAPAPAPPSRSVSKTTFWSVAIGSVVSTDSTAYIGGGGGSTRPTSGFIYPRSR